MLQHSRNQVGDRLDTDTAGLEEGRRQERARLDADPDEPSGPAFDFPSNQTIPDVFSLSLPTVKQILKRRLNWDQSRTDSRAIVGSPGLQPREEPGVSSRAAAAARPKPDVCSRYPQQVFTGGPELCKLSLVPRPLRSAACSKAVCLQGSTECLSIFLKGSRPAAQSCCSAEWRAHLRCARSCDLASCSSAASRPGDSRREVPGQRGRIVPGSRPPVQE